MRSGDGWRLLKWLAVVGMMVVFSGFFLGADLV
jgi:preprotein translocase subunit SecE